MKKIIRNLVLIVIVVLIAFYVADYIGVGCKKEPLSLNIPGGSNAFKIATILKENDRINNRLAFVVYSTLTGKKYHAGDHEIEGGGYKEIAKALTTPTAKKTIRVTIKEGSELHEIAAQLEKAGVTTVEEFNAQAKPDNFDYWFLKDLPKRDNPLEGYLFPDTYEFTAEEGAKSVINKMLDNFDNKFTKERQDKAKAMNKTVDEIVIMASVVEREAAVKNEFPLVAGVFYNRINGVGEANGKLESCATVQYILKERKAVLSVADTQIKSPYNTYVNKGLPVGPISAPGLTAIDAALNPAKTEYLYFVASGTGQHYFAKTYQEHLANMKKAGL